MPRVFLEYLEGNNIYVCRYCNTHLTALHQLISRTFVGQTGKAFLFNKVINVRHGEAQEKKMMTGMHTVRDLYCAKCNNILGWMYVIAVEPDQKYKEGKFILEKYHLNKENWIDT